MNLASIGATGRVGPCIVRELSRRGHTVTAISKHRKNIEVPPGVSAHYGDANNPKIYQRLIADHEVVGPGGGRRSQFTVMVSAGLLILSSASAQGG